MKIMLAGDTHGNQAHLDYLVNKAKLENVERIVQLGDFGYTWPGSDIEDILPILDGIPLYFIDGNHDNFDDLMARGIFGSDQIEEVVPGINYIPRGVAFTWGHTKILGLGGAFSIDKAYRQPHVSWWPQELITESQVRKACDVGKVDLMLTHDAPNNAVLLDYMEHNGYKLDRDSCANRAAVSAVVNVCEPGFLVHGHYHWPYRGYRGGWPNETLVVGLGRDTMGRDSYEVIDV